MRLRLTTQLILFLMLTLLLAGCGPAETLPTLPPTDTSPPVEAATDTPAGPTATPTPVIDYIGTVNGEGIRQTSFEASLGQLNQALADFPELLAEGQTAEEKVIEELVNRAVLSQAARAGGFTADEAQVESTLSELIEQAGGEEAFTAWLTANGYTLESFRAEIPLELEAAWQRDQIAAGVPAEVEQVRAQQILFYDPYLASRAYDQLNVVNFETIAQNNDPEKLGYLDWVPRGVLLFPELEEVLFSLQPGQHSEIIETIAGYHILYVYERDAAHPLSGEARLILQEKAVADWLAGQRAQAAVEITLP